MAAACLNHPHLHRPRTVNWYCIHTKPLKETLSQRYLEETLGLETYFPKLRETKRIRRVRREVTSPLFPRYLFCRFDAAQAYRAVKYAPDVLGIVSFGGTPTIVADALIQEIRNWAGEALDVVTVRPGLQPGDHVEIVAGPMRGLRAVILHGMRDSERVAVLLTALNFDARAIIDRSDLARAV